MNENQTKRASDNKMPRLVEASKIAKMKHIHRQHVKDKYNAIIGGPDIALEAAASGLTVKMVNAENESMQIRLLTDEIIEDNGLRPVTNPIMFEKGGEIPTPDGLFSEDIFGTTQEFQMKQFAYIDLKQKFIHPYIFEVLVKVYRNIDRIAAGEGAWYIDEKHQLIEIKDENDPRYDDMNTGLSWLIENYKNIKFEMKDSLARKEKLKLLKSLDENEIFISKWIVIPPFYRAVEKTSGRPSVPKLNTEYNNLIRKTNSLHGVGITFFNNKALYDIEMTLVNIRRYGQSLIGGKRGVFHQAVLGKSVDRGSRDVISTPVMNNYERPKDKPVDICHTGFPLSKCIVLGYPFIIKWLQEFFDRQFGDRTTYPAITSYDKDGKAIVEDIPIQDPSTLFTKDYIDKHLVDYMHTPTGRFDPIVINTKDGRKMPVAFTGTGYSRTPQHSGSSTISQRPLTWTDVFFMACEEELSDKFVYITRYPIENYQSIFPNQCRVLSTLKTMPMKVGDRIYEYYPIIDTTIPEEKIPLQFIDTVTMSNLFLKAIGGDYDGDTTSEKMVYSLEANQEAFNIMTSPKQYIAISGELVRTLSNESILTFYCMTKGADT